MTALSRSGLLNTGSLKPGSGQRRYGLGARALQDIEGRVATAVANGVVFESSKVWGERLAARVKLLESEGFEVDVIHGYRIFLGARPGRVEISSRYEWDGFCERQGIDGSPAALGLEG